MKKYGIVKDDLWAYRIHLGRLRIAYIPFKKWTGTGFAIRCWWFIARIYKGEFRPTAYVQVTILGLQIAFFYKGKLQILND